MQSYFWMKLYKHFKTVYAFRFVCYQRVPHMHMEFMENAERFERK